MEETAGRDLKWFFDQWVYGAGYPVFEVSRSGPTVQVRQVQPRKGGQDLFRISVPARIGADGAVRTLSVTRERHTFTLPPGTGDFLRFGVGGDLLMTVRLEQPLASWAAMLDEDPDFTGRMDAAEALEEFGPEAVPALAQAVRGDRAWAVRQKAVEVLGRIETPEATAAILPATKDADGRVRETAMAALGKKARADVGAALAETVARGAPPVRAGGGGAVAGTREGARERSRRCRASSPWTRTRTSCAAARWRGCGTSATRAAPSSRSPTSGTRTARAARTACGRWRSRR